MLLSKSVYLLFGLSLSWASGKTEGSLQFDPKNCVESDQSCLVYSGSFSPSDSFLGILKFDKETVILREKGQKINFIKGALQLEAVSELQNLYFEYGSIEVKNGKIWIAKQNDRVHILNVSADIKVIPNKSELKSIELPIGHSMWLGRQAHAGNQLGLPISADSHNWLKFVSESSQVQLKKDFDLLGLKSLQIVNISSQLYLDATSLSLSQQQAQQQEVEARRKSAELERKNLRDLFRKRFTAIPED